MATTTEFYQIFNLNTDTTAPTIQSSFQGLIGRNFHFQDDYDRDFYHLRTLENGNIGGIFRKIRTDEQIEIGAVGNDGSFIDFEQGQGKFENNPFVYFPQYNLIGYMRNIHANHYTRLKQCLCEAFGRNIGMSPLITRASIQSLLEHRQVVKLNCAIPVTPQIRANGGNWSGNAIRSLAESGADMVEFDVRINLRRNDHGGVTNALESIQDLLGMGATKVVATTENVDGKYDVIDLIADKIIHTDESFSYTRERYTPDDAYYKITEAYLSKLDDIEQTQRAN